MRRRLPPEVGSSFQRSAWCSRVPPGGEWYVPGPLDLPLLHQVVVVRAPLGADAELEPAGIGSGLESDERSKAGRHQAGPAGSSQFGRSGCPGHLHGYLRGAGLQEERVFEAALKEREGAWSLRREIISEFLWER